MARNGLFPAGESTRKGRKEKPAETAGNLGQKITSPPARLLGVLRQGDPNRDMGPIYRALIVRRHIV